MKLTKKKVLVTALAVSLIAILSFGTLAWFTGEDEVTNTFMTADSDDDAATIFSVDVYETGDNKNGEGIDYSDVVPGDELEKKAYVTNTGKYDQYIRVKVTLSDVSKWLEALGVEVTGTLTAEAILAENVDLTQMFVVPGGVESFARSWDLEKDEVTYDATNDEITYVYYFIGGDAILSAAEGTNPAETVQFLEGVVIPGALEQDDVVAMDGSFQIKIKAEAIQSDNTGSTPQEAFTKF